MGLESASSLGNVHSAADTWPCAAEFICIIATLCAACQVMVAGSEPTGEYRVQYFTPAYLLNGTPQPSISSAPTTLGYAAGFTVTFTLASGSIGRCAGVAGPRGSVPHPLDSVHVMPRSLCCALFWIALCA